MADADSPVNDRRDRPDPDQPAEVNRESQQEHPVPHVDVLIVGAGLSGIGAAWRLREQCPGRSYVILEGREALGGTWDLFRYPGIRSDSDMFTFGYPFRAWHGQQVLADGPSIRAYLADTAAEAGIDRRIRYQTRVLAASWSSEQARWTVTVQVGPDATPGTYTCAFLWICSGYYDYEHPHRPTFPGESEFEGTIVHPQLWPPDLQWDAKRVVVVGSGATAVTLVPALAGRAGSVTMLQRSPTWMTARPSTDRVADALRRRLPAGVAHRVLRARNVTLSQAFYQLCRRRPEMAGRLLRSGLERLVDDDALLDAHFTPTYQPWDQRLCVMPDGDLVREVAEGRAAIVTDTIDRFVPEGIRLASGRVLAADLVVLATGLTLLPLGAIELRVDGAQVDVSTRFAYQGLMLSGVPNLALTVGYTNASWTLRADLVARFVTRLLQYMDQHGVAYAVPSEPTDAAPRPLLDMTSGYIRRSEHLFPRQADRNPWRVGQNYLVDRWRLGRADVTEEMTMVTWKQLRAGSGSGSRSGSGSGSGSAEREGPRDAAGSAERADAPRPAERSAPAQASGPADARSLR